MTVEKEIEYRNTLLKTLHEGGKISKEDRDWLQTHVAYNSRYGYPIISRDIIKIKPNVKYNVCVNFINARGINRISPLFIIPLNKGYISTNEDEIDANRKISKGIRSKSISTMNSKENAECEFMCLSKLGLISICYECETTDWRGVSHMSSSIFRDKLAMRKEEVSDNKIVYYCTDFENEEFDGYVFSVEWNED